MYALVASTYFYFYYDYLEYFIFPENPGYNRHFFYTNLLGQALYFTFLYHVVKKENIGRYKKWILNYAVFILLISIANISISFFAGRWAVFVGDIFSIINSIIIGLIIVGLFRKVSNTAKLILIGSLILIISGATTIIINLYNYSVYHIFLYQIGFSLELLMFAIALNFSYYNERIVRIKKQLDLEKLKTEKLEKEQEVDKLNKEIDKKNRDLTYKAIVISQKESLEKNILKQLTAITPKEKIEKDKLNGLISNLKSNINNTHWNEFENHFTSVHPLFYKSLYEKYPKLTANEYKICAFLKMNLSSKEIALITGKSQQSVDVARSRLRKKMGLENHENINTIIAGITSN